MVSGKELSRLYLTDRLTAKQIGKKYGYSENWALKWLRRYGIPRRKRLDYPITPPSKRGPPPPPQPIRLLRDVPKIELSDEERIWVASAIDFEGTITLRYWIALDNSTGFCMGPSVGFSLTDKPVVEHFAKLVGIDNVLETFNKKKAKEKGWKMGYTSRTTKSSLCYAILKAIKDKLMIERKQRLADLVIEFIETVDEWRKNGNFAYPERALEIFQEVRKLNKRGSQRLKSYTS